MNKAFVREPEQTADYCPRCGSKGKAVGVEALKSYLSRRTAAGVGRAGQLLSLAKMRRGLLRRPGTGRHGLGVGPSRLSQRPDCADLCLFRPDAARHRAGRCGRGRYANQGRLGKGQISPGPLRRRRPTGNRVLPTSRNTTWSAVIARRRYETVHGSQLGRWRQFTCCYSSCCF